MVALTGTVGNFPGLTITISYVLYPRPSYIRRYKAMTKHFY